MAFLGAHYYHTEYFAITDQLRPGLAYERALECAEKHGDTKADAGTGTVKRAYNDAGEIIGYIVRSRHYVGETGSDHADRVVERPAARRPSANAKPKDRP